MPKLPAFFTKFYKRKNTKTTSIAFKKGRSYIFFKRPKLKYITLPFFVIVTIALSFAFFIKGTSTEASWYNDNWQYRKPITIENTGSAVTNQQVKVDQDTATLISGGKLQSSCQDIRFTDKNGNLLNHRVGVVSGGSPVTYQSVTTYQGFTSGTSASFSHTVSSGQQLFVVAQVQRQSTGSNTFDVTSITWNGVGLTEGPEIHANDSFYRGYHTVIYYSLSPAAGTYNITINTDVTVHDYIVGAFNFTGVNSLGNSATDSSTTLGNTTLTTTLNTTVSNSVILGGGGGRSDFGNISINNGTEVYDLDTSTTNQDTRGNAWYYNPGSIGSHSVTMTRSGSSATMAAIDLLPDPGGVTGDTCNNASTDFYVLMPEINAGDNTIYMYYGNPSADDIADQTAFNQTEFTPNSTTAGSEEQSPGPLVYFKFDEGVDNSCPNGGDACNSASADYNGSKSGAVWESISCVSGSCLYFDDDQDYLTAISGTTGTDSFEVDEFTVGGWVKATDAPITDGGLIASTYHWNGGGANGRGWDLGLNYGSTDRLSFQIMNTGGGARSINYDGFYADHLNEWVHVMGVYSNSGNYLRLYINGELYGETITYDTIGYSASAIPMRVGCRADNTSQGEWEGYIDEFKFYTYARTADEVKADYNSLSSKGAAANIGSDTQRNLTDGLLGYWKFDEGSWNGTSGEVIDFSGNGNNATSYNTITNTAGKFGGAPNLDGSADYFDIPYNQDLQLQDNFTISAWIYSDVLPTDSSPEYRDMIYSARDKDSPNNGLGYMISGSGCVGEARMTLMDGGGSPTATFSTDCGVIKEDTWHFVSVTYDDVANVARHYVDGQLVAENTNYDQNFADSLDAQDIGRQRASLYEFDGYIDELRIYNRALSPAEVRDLYAWAPGPILHYKLDENDGTSTTYDTSGNSYNGTLTSINSASWVPGKYGSALNLDGSADYITATTEDANVSISQFTYTAWVKQSSDPGVSRFIIDNRDANDDGVVLLVSNVNPDKFMCQYNAIDTTGTTTVVDDTWYHVACIADGSNIKLYVNGVLETSSTQSGSISEATDLRVGARSHTSPASYFPGVIDDVRVYNYPLTESQITNIINARAPGETTVGSPIGHWKFDEGYGSTTNDSGAGGNTATISGASWSNDGKYAKALSFDGTNDNVNLSDNSIYEADLTSKTWSAWIKTSGDITGGLGDIRSIFSKYPSVTNQPRYEINISKITGYLNFTVESSTNDILTSIDGSTDLRDGGWHHIAVVRDRTADEFRLYVNGQSDTTPVNDGDYDGSNDGNLYIGDRGNNLANGRGWQGLIDEVKIYNYALTEDEVKLEYNRGSGIVFGSLSTESNGTNASNSSSREYCVPGDTSTCNPPVLEYKFDENTGTTSTYDTSGNGYTGTLTSITSGSWVPGAYGSALQFDGSADYVSVPGTPLNTSQSTGTISAWVKPLDTTDTEGIFSTLENRDRFMFIDGSTFKASMYDGTGATFRILSGGTVDSNWHFLTFSWDIGNGSLKFYVDGVLADSYSGSSWTTAGTASGTYLARSTSANSNMPATDYFEGSIDQFIIYDYVRTPAQIAWEYNKGAPIAHYKFDECQGTTIYNSAVVGKDVAAGNNGTLTIGATGTNTSTGTCSSGTGTEAWNNGTTGKYGSAMAFDGTDDYVTVADSAIWDTGSAVTISHWFKTSTNQSGKGLLVHDASNYKYLTYITTNSGILQFYIRTATGVTNASYDKSTGYFADGEWHHFVGTYDRSTSDRVKLYFDGQLVATATGYDEDISAGDEGIQIGQWQSGSKFTGQIDDVQIYNYALTATQVKTLYNRGAVRLE